VALPISGGFSGSPVPDPLREYVTLIDSAGAVGAAQMLSAKAQATAGRKVLMSTLHVLSGWFRVVSEPTWPSRSKKLVVKPLLTAKLMCLRRIGKTGKPVISRW
jgi:hypothetical protein